MIVCLCRGVTDRQIEEIVRRGACSVDEVSYRCGAGEGCGSCRPSIQGYLREGAKQNAA